MNGSNGAERCGDSVETSRLPWKPSRRRGLLHTHSCSFHRGRTTFSHLPLGSWLRNPDSDVMLMKPGGLVLDSGSEQESGGEGSRGEEEKRTAQREAASAFRPSRPEASCWLVYTQPEPSRAEPSRAQPRPPPCPHCSGPQPRWVFLS